MPQVMANMREERALGFHPLHDAQRILHRRVRGVRLVPQGIQKENIQPFQLLERRLWDFAVIGEISRTAKAKAVDFSFAMNQAHGLKASPEEIDRPINRP